MLGWARGFILKFKSGTVASYVFSSLTAALQTQRITARLKLVRETLSSHLFFFSLVLINPEQLKCEAFYSACLHNSDFLEPDKQKI